MKQIRDLFFAVSALGLISSAAHAVPGSVIFSQPGTPGEDVVGSDNNVGIAFADDFSIGASKTISGIAFWGNEALGGNSADDFDITFYSDAAGLPGSVISSTVGAALESKTATGTFDVGGFELYKYVVALSGPLLAPGATYYVSVVNNLTGQNFWMWNYNSLAGVNFNNDGTGWVSTRDGNLAFELYGVAEPATLSLLGLGLFGLARTRRLAK